MSKIKSPDIEIFVLTYNRASLIIATLESLLGQVLPASRICVFDNGSTDDTAKVVKSFAARGVELISRKSNDPCACMPELQSMARGPWTMLFHDDDLLHPNYLRDATAALAHEPQASVIVSAMRASRDPEHMEWGRVRKNNYRFMTGRQLAAHLYAGFPMPFCSALFRVDTLKQGDFRSKTFGKIGDRPFIVEAARAGGAIVMLDSYVKYRIHPGQDSADQATGPFLPEVFALQRYYRKILGERLTDFPGRIFLRRNYRNLLREFYRLNRNMSTPMTWELFFRSAIEAEATSPRSIKYGKSYAALTKVPRWIERKFKVLVRKNVFEYSD